MIVVWEKGSTYSVLVSSPPPTLHVSIPSSDGHVERMEDSRIPKREMREKIYTRKKRGRFEVRWLHDVQEDLREMGLKDGEGKLRIETSGGE
jgi:hypothetical protein